MLAINHKENYESLTQSERIQCLGYSLSAFIQLTRNVRDRKKRESLIPYEDYEQVVQQIIEYPYLGGGKGALKLLSEQKALIGSTLYQEIKQELMLLAAEELRKRKERSELANNHYSRKYEQEKEFKRMEAYERDDIWAIDFVDIWLFGILFALCVVYELHSQSYLALVPGFCATEDLAISAVNTACEVRNTIPKKCMLRDGGAQFSGGKITQRFEDLNIITNTTPPGTPWNNGALESGNRDLKKALYTNIFYSACIDTAISKKGVAQEDVFAFLQGCCGQTKDVINTEIVRPKFKATPDQVIKGEVVEKNREMAEFKIKKLAERKERAKKGGVIKSKAEKVKQAWNKIHKTLGTEKLFSFLEITNNRFRTVQI